MSQKAFYEPVGRWERRVLWFWLIFFVTFGVLVEHRSAFLKRRMGDLGCYLRAAWAVRQGGAEMYHVMDDNHWHYNYPPLYAILLSPLGDPPTRDASLTAGTMLGLAGTPGGTAPLLAAASLPASPAPLVPNSTPVIPYVPYVISVAVIYLLNVFLLCLSLHVLASALEETAGRTAGWRQPQGSRRWWLLRTVPFFVCLSPLAHTLMRGQANPILLVLFCSLMAGLMRGRSLGAGLCLAGAICLKIFPTYLLLVPLWRRDRRCLAGCAIGLTAGVVLIPVLVLGPKQTVTCYRELAQVLVGPALGLGGDHSRANELIHVTATDSQSFRATIHNTLHLNPWTRPDEASPLVCRLHWVIGGVLTLLTLLAGRRHRLATGSAVPLHVGSLILIMLLLSPVCHTHYFSMAIPLIMGLLALSWERQAEMGRDMSRTRVNGGLKVLIGIVFVGFLLPMLPFCQVLRDAGLMMYLGLLLWGTACVALWRRPARAEATGQSRLQAA